MSIIATSATSSFVDPRIQLRIGLARFVTARQRALMLRYAIRGVAAGGLLAAFAGGLAQAFELTYGLAAAVCLLLGFTIGAAIVGWRRRVRPTRIALDIDHQLALDERVTTALELAGLTSPLAPLLVRQERVETRGRPHPSRLPLGEGPGVRLTHDQISDAVAHLGGARPGAVYPIRLRWRSVGLAVAMLALAVLPWLVSWPAVLTARVTPSRVSTATQAEAARLDALAQQIEQQSTPADSTTRAQIAAQLRQAADAIRQSRADSTQAIRDLQQAQQATNALAPQTGEDASLTLARIADALNSQTLTQPATSALDQQDVNQAAADLQQLASNLGGMSAQQRLDLASALQSASNAAQGSETDAAKELQQAANAARNGDAQGMQQAAQALQQLGTASQAQRDVAQAQSELQSSSQAISQAAQNGSATANPISDPSAQASQAAQANPADSASPSSANGASSNGQNGSGDQSGDQPGGDQSGAAGQAGTGQQSGNQPGGGAGQGSTNHLGAATPLQDLAQRQVMVPSDQQGNPTSIQSSNQLQTGVAGTAQVDYQNVLPQYRQQAQQVVDSNVVPTGLKQVVKGYFDSLAPK